MLRKGGEGSTDTPVPTAAASPWIKPGVPEDTTEGEEVDDHGGQPTINQQCEEKSGKTSSAPASCYSMSAVATAAATAAVAAIGSRQRTFRTTRSLSSRSTSHLSSYDLASALETINNIIMAKTMRLQKATRLVGLQDTAASPRKRSDKVHVPVMLVLGLGLKAKFCGLGLGLECSGLVNITDMYFHQCLFADMT